MKFSKTVLCVLIVVMLFSCYTEVKCYPPATYNGCVVKVYRKTNQECLLEIKCLDGTVIKCGKFFSPVGDASFRVEKF